MLEREKDEAMRSAISCLLTSEENTTGWKAEHRGEGRRLSGAEKAAKRIDVKAE